jgi:hypothetical protein
MKTAVEWLVEELNQQIDFIPLDKWDMIRDIVLQAKEMEKQQIMGAYNQGSNDYGSQCYQPEQYYNETFKSE